MVKKVLLIVIGLGMITAGVAGITTSVIDQKNKVALRQLEANQEEAKFAAAQEQKKLEEKRREMDKMAMTIQEEKQRLEDVKRRIEEEHRRAEEAKRTAEAALREQKKAASASSTGSGKDEANGKEKEPTFLARKAPKQHNDGKSFGASRPSRDLRASRQAPRDKARQRITQKVGLEAARLLEPVRYFNRRTGELIIAEPVDYSPGSVRVRVRTWKDERLVNDKLMSFSAPALNGSQRPRPWDGDVVGREPGLPFASRI